jgi:hypothetical protein
LNKLFRKIEARATLSAMTLPIDNLWNTGVLTSVQKGQRLEKEKNGGGVGVTRSKGSKRPRESKKIQAFSLAGFGGSVAWLCQAWENLAVIWIGPLPIGDHAKANAGGFLRMRPGAPIYE